MSNTPRAAIAVPEMTTAGPRKLAKADLAPFRIDGETYTMVKPKQAVFAQAASALDSALPMNDMRNIQIMLSFVQQWIACVEVLPPDDKGKLRGRDRLQQRVLDPHDALELEDLVGFFTKVMDAWFKRPTGSPRASTASRPAQPRARASRARTR